MIASVTASGVNCIVAAMLSISISLFCLSSPKRLKSESTKSAAENTLSSRHISEEINFSMSISASMISSVITFSNFDPCFEVEPSEGSCFELSRKY